jgi:hypothetical protein
MHTWFWWVNPGGKIALEDLIVDGREASKWNVKK